MSLKFGKGIRCGRLRPPSAFRGIPRLITRDAFLYLDGNTRDFAQCSSCWLFDAKRERCRVLGPSFEVKAEDSCGYWGPGKPVDIPNVARFTPEEVGFVRRAVRCENCTYFKGGDCHLFRELNDAFPDQFDLNIWVEPRGCCNAQTPKGKANAKENQGLPSGR